MLNKGLVILLLSLCFTLPAQAQFLLVGNGSDFPTIQFQAADGLESQVQLIEYRHSSSPVYSPIKMPGLAQVGNITLRDGAVMNNSKFWDFYKDVTMNTVGRTTLVIHGPKGMMLTLRNAWPTRITGTNLDGKDGNQVTIKSMEIAFESLSLTFSN